MNISLGNSSSLPQDNFPFNPNVLVPFHTATTIVNLVLGLPTNVCVVCLILTGAEGLVASEFFLLNLAVSEIFYCLSNVLALVKLYVFENKDLSRAHVFFDSFILSGRPLFMCCMCVERYLAVVHPVIYLKYRPLRYRLICSGLVWLLVLGSCVTSIFVSFMRVAKYFYVEMYLFLLSVNIFCSIAVLRALKRPKPGDGERNREATDPLRKAFKIILVILVSMLVNYLPLIVTILCLDHLSFSQFFLAAYICYTAAVVTGFVQPFLYLHRAGKLACIREA